MEQQLCFLYSGYRETQGTGYIVQGREYRDTQGTGYIVQGREYRDTQGTLLPGDIIQGDT